MKYVQFNDKQEIIRVFACPQDPRAYENLGELEDDDEQFLLYVESLPVDFRDAVLSM